MQNQKLFGWLASLLAIAAIALVGALLATSSPKSTRFSDRLEAITG